MDAAPDPSEPLTTFLERVAARTSAPGAGAGAAVAAALGAALAEMAARYADDDRAAASARVLRERALPLAAADAEAYARVLAASGDERERALSEASDVPLAVAKAGAEAAALAAGLADGGKRSLAGDAAAGAAIAAAAARVAAMLVAINLPGGADPRVARAEGLAREAEAAAERAGAAARRR